MRGCACRNVREVAGRLRSAAALALIGACLLTLSGVVLSTQAQAHSGSLPDSQYYRSTITGVQPAVAGLQIALDATGETLTVTNHTGSTVEVPGYTGEEYLRITPTGVEENTNSVSAFLNGSLVIQGLPQQLGSAQKPPAWKHVSDTPSYSWHDHRVHWMAQQRPPVVATAPTTAHVVFTWAVPLKVGTTDVTVNGVLKWIGAPAYSSLQVSLYIFAGVVVLLCVGVLAIRVRNMRESRGRDEAPTSRDPVSTPR